MSWSTFVVEKGVTCAPAATATTGGPIEAEAAGDQVYATCGGKGSMRATLGGRGWERGSPGEGGVVLGLEGSSLLLLLISQPKKLLYAFCSITHSH